MLAPNYQRRFYTGAGGTYVYEGDARASVTDFEGSLTQVKETTYKTALAAAETAVGLPITKANIVRHFPRSDVRLLEFDPVFHDVLTDAAGITWSPDNALKSLHYQVAVKSQGRPDTEYQDLFVFQSKNDWMESIVESNDAYQIVARPYMTDTNNWATFDFSDGPVVVKITPINGPTITAVRILPDVGASTVTFTGSEVLVTLPSPEMVYIEINGNSGYYRDNPIFLYSDAIETSAMDPFEADYYFQGGEIPDDIYSGKIYIDNGIHAVGGDGVMKLQSGTEVYIKGGAYLKGRFYGASAANVKIHGRGIVSGIHLVHGDYDAAPARPHMFNFPNLASVNLEITGITMTDGAAFYCTTDGTTANFHHLKLMGWHTHTDGFSAGANSTYADSFLKVNDDILLFLRSSISASRVSIWQQFSGAAIQHGWIVSGAITGCTADSIYIVEADNEIGGEILDDTNRNNAVVGIVNMDGGSVTNVSVTNLTAYNQVYQLLDIGMVKPGWSLADEGGTIDNWTLANWTITDVPYISSYIKQEGSAGSVGTINLNGIMLGGELLDGLTHLSREEIRLFGGAPSPVFGA